MLAVNWPIRCINANEPTSLERRTGQKNAPAALEDATRQFMDFCRSYSRHFVGWGMNSVEHARHYLSGLLGTQRRKHIETIGEDVGGSDFPGMEQFVSSSPWDLSC